MTLTLLYGGHFNENKKVQDLSGYLKGKRRKYPLQYMGRSAGTDPKCQQSGYLKGKCRKYPPVCGNESGGQIKKRSKADT